MVSVVIPAYNVEDFISKSIESVMAQYYSEIELICVDNNSTDSTAAIINELKKKYPKIQILHQAKKGASCARNLGLAAASGDYIQFLDSDDIIRPEKIFNQVLCARKNNFPDIIFSDYSRVFQNNSVLEVSVSMNDIWSSLLSTRLGVTSSLLFKTKAVQLVGGWNEELESSQEYDLLFRILKGGATFAFAKGNFTNVYDRPGYSISSTNIKENWERYTRLRIEILDFVEKNKINVERLDSYRQCTFDSIRILYQHNPKLASKFFQESFNRDFQPVISPSTGFLYKIVFFLFGFEVSEWMKKTFDKFKYQ